MSITLEQLAQFVEQLANRVDEIENRAAAGNTSNANTNATQRIKIDALAEFDAANPGVLSQGADDNKETEDGTPITGIYGYDVSGRTDTYKDRDTGLPAFWVVSSRGKKFLVDIMGIPMFLHNPLREQAYEEFNAKAGA